MEPINKVLASTAQAFNTAEQAQARANIDAQKTIAYSYSGATITAIDGSAVGATGGLSVVNHDSNLSGSGTSGSPLGLSDNVVIWNSGTNYSANITPSSLSIAAPYQDPLFSAALGEVYMSGHAGNLVSPYTASLFLTGLRLSGYDDTFEYSGTANYSFDGLAMNNASASATLTPGGFTYRDSADNKVFISKTGTEIQVPFGLTSVAKSKYGHYATEYEVVLPGDVSESCYYSIGGIRGCASFGDYMYSDNWKEAKRYEGTGDSGNSLTIDIGHATTAGVSKYPKIVMGVPSASSTIYMSSISSWDNKLDSINVGYGLAGNGVDSALNVTAVSSVFDGMHTTYTTKLSSDSLTMTDYDKDYTATVKQIVISPHGLRLSGCDNSSNASSIVRVEAGVVDVNQSGVGNLYINASSLRIVDSAYNYVDLTMSSIKALSAVYDWATSQGMQPI